MKNISLEGKGMAGVIEATRRYFLGLIKDTSALVTVPTSVINAAPDERTEPHREIQCSGDLYRKVMDESKASGKPWEARVHPGYYGE